MIRPEPPACKCRRAAFARPDRRAAGIRWKTIGERAILKGDTGGTRMIDAVLYMPQRLWDWARISMEVAEETA
jgi:hypothetical protein